MQNEKIDIIAKDLILIIDYDYFNYEGNIVANQSNRGMFFDTSSLVLSSISAASGGESSKTVLSAISSGIQATRTNVNRHYFSQQSVDVLIKRMRALRKEILAGIGEKLENRQNKPYTNRDLIIDLQKYYRAGTVSSAAQDILEEAAAATKEKTENAKFRIESLNKTNL